MLKTRVDLLDIFGRFQKHQQNEILSNSNKLFKNKAGQ